MNEKIILGVDIGGTHISCACVDVLTQKILRGTKIEVPVNSHGSADEILKSWKGAIKDACQQEIKPYSIGVAMPGPFDYENGICKMRGVDKFESIYDVNVKEVFSEASGIETGKILFMNDAACSALGEYIAGSGRGSKRMVAVTLGTGFGSAFISDGKIVSDGLFVPQGGMFWNVPYKNGIADDYFSTRWFIETYFKQTGIRVNGVADIIADFKNNKHSLNIFTEFANNLAWFLMPWLKLFEADRFVIGGSISKAEELFVPLMQYIFAGEKYNVDVRTSALGYNAALIGSANLFKNF